MSDVKVKFAILLEGLAALDSKNYGPNELTVEQVCEEELSILRTDADWTDVAALTYVADPLKVTLTVVPDDGIPLDVGERAAEVVDDADDRLARLRSALLDAGVSSSMVDRIERGEA